MAKILFAQSLWHEYLGIMQLSAILNQYGHSTDVVIGNKKAIHKCVKECSPDLIAFSMMTVDRAWVSETARFLREKGIAIPIIVGGPHPTFFPDFIHDYSIDIVCRGEGEYAILDLVHALESGTDITTIPNLIVKKDRIVHENSVRPPIENLDELPPPTGISTENTDFSGTKRLPSLWG